jgi:hypothetical protein
MTTSPEHALERRYRRLLSWYPADYRAVNADEMLGVVMARSADGQRWPGLGETVSLIAGAIRTRTGVIPAGIRSEAWQRASAVVSIIGAILLASSGARQLFIFAYDSNDSFGYLSRGPVAECAGWTLVAIAAILCWRRVAAFGAVAGFAGEVAWYWRDLYQMSMLRGWPTLVLAATVAAAGLVAVRNRGRVLSQRAILSMVLGAILVAGWQGVRDLVYAPLFSARGNFWDGWQSIIGTVDFVLLVAMLVVVLTAAGRLQPVVRRRVLVTLAPAFAAYILVRWLGAGSLVPSVGYTEFVSFQWACIAGLPVAVFLGGLIWLARYERTLRRAAREGVAA